MGLFSYPKTAGIRGKKVTWVRYGNMFARTIIKNGMAKMAEEFASYIIEDKPVPKYQSVEIAGYRLLKTAEAAHKSNDEKKLVKINYRSMRNIVSIALLNMGVCLWKSGKERSSVHFSTGL